MSDESDKAWRAGLAAYLASRGYDRAARQTILGHAEAFGTCECCPAFRDQSHTSEAESLLPVSPEWRSRTWDRITYTLAAPVDGGPRR